MSTRLRTMMTSKIHRATVTRADLDYVGSITVDADLLDAADLLPGERVDVCDCTNGNRLSTYVIPGERGSGQVCINGAAAHLVHPGDLVILIGYSQLPESEARVYLPHVVFVDERNRIVERGSEPGQVPSESHAARMQGLRPSGTSLSRAREARHLDGRGLTVDRQVVTPAAAGDDRAVPA